jgi:hypothetical protein
MANNKNLLKLYLIGMLATVIGFCCPMFKGLLGSTRNGFSFIDFNSSGFVSIGAILIFFGALAGVIFSLISVKSLGIIKLLAVIATIAGVVVLIVGFTSNGVYKFIGEALLKNALFGFYLVVAGIILAAVGYATNK